MRSPLSDEQIAETLRRYDLPEDAPLLGIAYGADRAVLMVRGATTRGANMTVIVKLLTVPPDVLDYPVPSPVPRRIFNRPS